MNMSYKILFIVTLCCSGLLKATAQNTPDLNQVQLPGIVTGGAPVPLPYSIGQPFPIHYVRTMVPKYRDTASSQINDAAPIHKVAVSTTYLNGMGAQSQVRVRRTNADYIVQPAPDHRYTELYQFQPYISQENLHDHNAIYNSTRYHSSALYPSEGGAEVSNSGLSASKLINSSSSAERSSTSYAAGRSRMGQDKGTKTQLVFNDGNMTGVGGPGADIRIWTISNGLPVSNSYYAANQLKGTLTTNNSGLEKWVFEDRGGKPIYETVLQESKTVIVNQNVSTVKTYATTYYVYDEMDRLRFVLPPKAVQAAAAGTVSQAVLDELCFAYKYDAKGRQYAIHKPGEQGYTELVYNVEGQVIMRRSPLENTMGRWEMIFYDRQGRVMATGLYRGANTREDWQNRANAQVDLGTTNVSHYHWGAGRYSYPVQGTVNYIDFMSYNYYDSYESNHPLATENFSSMPIQAYLSSVADAEPYVQGSSTYGLLTSSAVRVIKPTGLIPYNADWTYSKIFYDKENRPIYTVSQNATGGKDTSAIQYNYKGQVLISLRHHRNLGGAGKWVREYYRNTYNADNSQLVQSEHKTDNTSWKLLNSHIYDELGRVKLTTYGTNAETQNFSYNIRGELQGINETYARTGNKEGQAITFGELLRYDYGFTQPRYDGLVAGMVWRGSGGGNANAHAYGYSYDLSGRMLKGEYNQGSTSPSNTPATGWSQGQKDYTETVSYDIGGNIQSLKRKGVGVNGSMVGVVDLDRLNYTYTANSNKLQKVVDTVTTNYNRGDYLNGTVQGYTYDAGGNIVSDLSKGISSIVNTYFNKPQIITFSNGNKIYYTYDAGGAKLQEQTIVGSDTTRADYLGNAQYKNHVLQSLSTGVGRTNMTKGSPSEEYFIKDHLGNVRSVVSEGGAEIGGPMMAKAKTYEATFEAGNIAAEEQVFDKVALVQEDKPGSSSNTDNKAALLDGKDANKMVGSTLLLKVMAADKISLNAENFYEATQQQKTQDNNSAVLEQLMSQLATAGAGIQGIEGGTGTAIANNLRSTAVQEAYAALQDAATDPDKPKAYLNYLFFDENLQLLPEYSRIWQADGEGNWSKIGTQEEETIEMPKSGYVATYISNQGSEIAFFDNVALTLEPGVLLEEKHYYPYGLPIVGLGSTASGMLKNRERYQGNEYREELGLNWMDFHNRQYDPQLGRFLSIDPLADAGGQQVLSPYHAMACNPVSMVDPLGLEAVFGERLIPDRTVNPLAEAMARFPTLANFFNAPFAGMDALKQSMEDGMEMKFREEFWGNVVASIGGSGEGDVSSGSSNSGGTKHLVNSAKKLFRKVGQYSFSLNGISRAKLEEIANNVGRQRAPYTQCNIFSLRFINKVLFEIFKANGLDETKLPSSEDDIESFASPNSTKDLLDQVNAKYELMGTTNLNSLAKRLRKGEIPYVIEYNGVSNHRVVIVEIQFNIHDIDAASARVYNPKTGKIEERPNFFVPFRNPNLPIPNRISNINNSFYIKVD